MVDRVRSLCGDTKKKKKKKPYCTPFAMGAADRSQMKESYKWNRVLLFRRIELVESARAREPELVSIDNTSGESLGFQRPFIFFFFPFYFLSIWSAALNIVSTLKKKYVYSVMSNRPRDFGK
jgi:hypothetical protein